MIGPRTAEQSKRRLRPAVFFAVMLVAIATPPITAGWLQEDTPVCTDPASQSSPQIIPDRSGGGIIAWKDSRDDEIYAQRLDPSGAPLWALNGVNVSQNPGSEGNYRILPDGTGGAFISFEAQASPCQLCAAVSRLNVGRISADGALLWKNLAKSFTPASWDDRIDETTATLLPDGSGGVVVVWQLAHGYYCDPFCMDPPCCYGWGDYDLYAQRFDAQGVMLWDSSGVLLCANDLPQETPTAAMIDSSIVITWSDHRNDPPPYYEGNGDIFAQRIDLDGNLLWSPEGVPVCVYSYDQVNPQIACDGLGGSFITWRDYRSGDYRKGHIYAQRLDSQGNALWALNGIALSTSDGEKEGLAIIASSPGCAVAKWTNILSNRPSSYAQRVDSLGNSLWAPNGQQLNDPTMQSTNLRAIPDGEGGAVFAWEQTPNDGNATNLHSIWGSSGADIFAVGDLGLIFHYDGHWWTFQASYVPNGLNCVWGFSPSEVFAVGDGGIILHYDGSSWSTMPSGVTVNLVGVWGSSWDNVFAVGGGTILHYDGSSWSNETIAAANLKAIYGTSSTNVVAVGDKDYHTGVIMNFDGTSWQRTERTNDTFDSVWISPDNEVFIAGVEHYYTYGAIVEYHDAEGWHRMRTDNNGYHAYGIWGTLSNNVYVAFGDGSLMHFDGTSWSKTIASTNSLLDVWGTFGSDIWVVGGYFSIRHFDNPGWTTQYQLSNGDLFVQKVGASGQTEWTSVGAPATVSLDAQSAPSMAEDPAGFALLAWRDNRRANWDIFARKVSVSRGPLVATELRRFEAVPSSGGGIRVSWELTQFEESARFIVWRTCGPESAEWQAISPSITANKLNFSFVDTPPERGMGYRYRVGVSDASGSRVLFETGNVIMPAFPLTLYQNVPNPFNPATTIRYYLPERCRVRLGIYDVSGRLVARLVEAEETPGLHEAAWKGRSSLGANAASGVYFCRLQAGRATLVKKMILLR